MVDEHVYIYMTDVFSKGLLQLMLFAFANRASDLHGTWAPSGLVESRQPPVSHPQSPESCHDQN